MNSRRKFLTNSALASAAVMSGNLKTFAAETGPKTTTTNKNLKAMKLATVSWTFGIDDLDKLFKSASDIGFNGMQFCGDFNKYEADDVLEASKKYGVEVTSYDPLNCKPDSEEEATLENSVAFYKKAIDYAEALKVPMCTVQGLSFWTSNQPNYEAAMQQIINAVATLNDYAKVKNILLTYEACCHYETTWVHTSDELLRIVNESKADNLKLVLDSFHMNRNEKDMIEPINNIGSELLYSYHVSDSGRGGIGTGMIDYKSQFNALQEIGFDDLVCFEIVTPTVRPYKLPMNEEQFAEFEKQSKHSLEVWRNMMNS